MSAPRQAYQEDDESGVDRLSRLPPELLHGIYSLVYARSKPTAPLSRSLRPFYDAVKFDKIVARGSRIRSLYEMVTARPALGSAVREIRLVGRSSDTQLGTGDFRSLLGLLPNLRVLDISGSNSAPWLEAVFPTRDDAETALPPSIKVMFVESSDAHGAGYDAKVLAALKQLPNLQDVHLHFPGSSANQAEPSMVNFSLPGVKRLHLDLHGDGAAVGDFLACFPRLRSLSLRACEATCDFSSALAGVKSYKDLPSICLRGHPPLGWRFPDELAKFVALKTLSLDGDFAHVGIEAYGALRGVPITTLQVKRGCDVSAAGVETLLGPRGSCPTLKVLQLDNLSGAYPRHFCSEDFKNNKFYLGGYAGTSRNAEFFLSKFSLPIWMRHFSSPAYDLLECTAKLYGVVVKGSTVAGRQVELVHDGLAGEVERMAAEEEADYDGNYSDLDLCLMGLDAESADSDSDAV